MEDGVCGGVATIASGLFVTAFYSWRWNFYVDRDVHRRIAVGWKTVAVLKLLLLLLHF